MTHYLQKLCSNKIDLDRVNKPFCAIIGSHPSKGARSPLLWNYVTKKLNLDVQMICLDVDLSNLNELFLELGNDHNFLGGCLAVPHKSSAFKLIKCADTITANIEAINNISRDNGKLIGFNTDGHAALECIKNDLIKNLKGQKCILFGLGGTGQAVLSHLVDAVGASGQITVVTSCDFKYARCREKYQDRCNLHKSSFAELTSENESYSLVINCSPLGSNLTQKIEEKYFYFQPFGSLDSITVGDFLTANDQAEFEHINQRLIAQHFERVSSFLGKFQNIKMFDCVYQPDKTVQSIICDKQGIHYLNGTDMNKNQAVLAFENTLGKFIKGLNHSQIANLMSKAMT